ncbi:prepilin-type N-terminal cleavage/methylation domain-containing protein [Candidatus Uhrbacteria bacterium]|nr:prepilin-type N-terminal cleavage/methylation domain-containing protein [Candidatus Uhrbacteria bacterium]
MSLVLKKIIRDKRGQTLIELMAAVFVITTGLLGVLGLTTANVRSETTAVMRLTAFNLAREGAELARNIRDGNWLSSQPWDAGLTLATHCAVVSTVQTLQSFESTSCASDQFDSAYRVFLDSELYTQYAGNASVTAVSTQYYRRIVLDPICVSKTGEVAETVVTDGGCDVSSIMAGMQVTSEVVYKIAGRAQSARIIERLMNWR